MIVKVTSAVRDRKLMAITTIDNTGLYFRDPNCAKQSIFFNGETVDFWRESLEVLLEDKIANRTPIYEGDIVTIQF